MKRSRRHIISRQPMTDGIDDINQKEKYTPVEILNFSPRTLNALINGGIGSIEQLVKCTPGKLGNLRGFGKKAENEVNEALKNRGLSLAGDNDDLLQ